MDNLFWIGLVILGVYVLYSKGFIMTNFESVSAKVAYEMIENDDENNLTILDVRTPEEFKGDGYIADAKLIPVDQLEKNLSMLDKSKKVLVYCRSGSRSVYASRVLFSNGFVPFNLKGGIDAWKSENLPVKIRRK
ncbi:MAG: Rhodanese-like domain protein [uncultured Sulfurovum sp.]|uniref:Rhodanese-like domain protein n=1 Tax=uncultured Sulfurovum sp. TaxID=269237 RepID=A0A6S6SAA7_9BACT|nr:MAG: Rhodanese-like domain protein [uncultured Sulfurovum sp.]